MASAPPHDDAGAAASAARSGSAKVLERTDLFFALGLMVLGASLRLWWFSGFGLGDDLQWLGFLQRVDLTGVAPVHDNVSYRFTWWLPTLAACRLLGYTEAALVGPVLVAATLGIGLVYTFGTFLAGRVAGVIAALLLVVLPLDFAWSTMMTNDVFVSLTSGAALLCAVLALDADDERRPWLWGAAAAAVWLALHSKLNGVLIAPVIALVAFRRRDRVNEQALWFVIVAVLFIGGSMAVSYSLSGDAFSPYHAEIATQGLTREEDVVHFHRLTAPVFWTWLRTLFWPTQLGTMLFSVYPWLLVALLAVRPARRTIPFAASVWLLVVLVGLQLNSLARVNGVWVAGFRNVRHAHVLAYPIVLLLSAPLAALYARRRRPAVALIAVVLGVSLWQSIATASKTKAAFEDRRAAVRFLATQPLAPVFSDFQLGPTLALVWLPHPFHALALAPGPRREELTAVERGYCVTGGAREPVYGCVECIPAAAELPRGRWRLVFERPGPPPSSWRPEPLRVWEAAGGPVAKAEVEDDGRR